MLRDPLDSFCGTAARRVSVAARIFLIWLFSDGFLHGAEPAAHRVLINEIMYHAPDDRDDLQFIELFNAGEAAADLSGWSFNKGVKLVFPAKTSLGPGEYAVVCQSTKAFRAHYQTQARIVGEFTGRLSHSDERIELIDARGQAVDSVKYGDHSPWPMGPDGYSPTLERISPSGASEDPFNWAASNYPTRQPVGGTPGQKNDSFSRVSPPQVRDVRFDKPAPNRPLAVTATIADSTGVKSATLVWQAIAGEAAGTSTSLAMVRVSGNEQEGVYSASIPAQPEGRLIRFTIRAANGAGTERVSPGRNEPRPTFSYSTFVNSNSSRIPFLRVLTFGGLERPGAPRFSRGPQNRNIPQTPPARGSAAVVYLPAGGGDAVVFDHVRVRSRKGGLKIHFQSDQPLREMTGINLIFEGSPRYLLSEPLSYDLYRKAGVPAPQADHVRLWMDGRPLGYLLLVEQPNKAFLRRTGHNDDGNLYKLLWYEQGVVGQHEKKTNPHTGHNDIVQLVDGLNKTSGARQWEFIRQHFNVEEVINYFAVNMCIQNWDGFFNNYYAYHDLRPDGKWEIFPWDEDKTWGDYDGASQNFDWYTMPLTVGMNGSGFAFGGGFFGGGWARPPGWFSGPLLANAEFRKQFLARLRVVCEKVFTPEKMAPMINAMEHRLADEVEVRAKLNGHSSDQALREFRSHIQSFHNQVVNRRKFILKQLEAEK